MAVQPLTAALNDADADATFLTAGGQDGSVPREVLILLKNIQHQLNELDARITVFETP